MTTKRIESNVSNNRDINEAFVLTVIVKIVVVKINDTHCLLIDTHRVIGKVSIVFNDVFIC